MAVGLDIGSYSIKVVELIRTMKGYARPSFAIERIPSDSSQPQLTDIIRRTAKKASIKSNNVNISVAGENLVVKHIHIPRMSPSELRESLKLETEKYIPYSINDVVLDYHILQKVSFLATKKMLVLLVAAKKKFIDERIKMTMSAGLEPNIVDIDSFAIVRALMFNLKRERLLKKNNVTAVANIGNSVTTINVLMGEMSFFCRDIAIGGGLLTKGIQERFGLDFESAESLKCNPLDRGLEIFEAIKPGLNSMMRELILSFEYCESQLGKPVEVLYLGGGTSQISGIDRFLNEGLDMEVVPLDNPVLTVATGLALGAMPRYGLFAR